MGGLLRKLLIYICKPIYKLIPDFYSIFYNIANTRLFSEGDTTLQQLSANIYVLVSVVMLFAFSVTILSAIVNPDLLNDSKKGVTAAFKRAIIGLVLMVVIPFAFNTLYDVQKNIMDNSLIEKIVVGANFKCTETDENGKCEPGSNGGQVIAGNLISAVVYPVDDNVSIAANISKSYSKMIREDISYIGTIAKNINITREGGSDEELKLSFNDEDYAFEFNGLIAIASGLGICYILLLFSIDMAIRVFKLAFLELTAPISIVAYMAAGEKILQSWIKETLHTFLDVFVRVAAIAFYLFLISNLSSYLSANYFEGKKWAFVLKVLLIVGMLIFVKQIPDLINKMFGADINFKGGIGDKLGQMAVVGKQAQAAWGAVKQAAKLGAGAAGLAFSGPVGWGAAAAGIGLGVGGKKLWNNKIKDTSFGRGLSNFGSGVSAAGKTAGAYLKGKGLTSGLAAAKKAYSESDFGLEHIANKDYKKALKADEKYNKKFGFTDGSAEDGAKSNKLFGENIQRDLGKNRGDVVQTLHNANLRKATVDKISSDKDAIVSELDALKINAKTAAAVNSIESLKNAFASGKISSNEMRTKLNALIDNGSIDSSSGVKISGKLDSIENTLDNNVELKRELVGSNGELKLGSNLKEVKRQVEKKATAAKSTYDDMYKGSSENIKHEMDNYVSASDEIIRKSVDECSKGNDPGKNNINTVGTHYENSKHKENDGKSRVEIHSNPSGSSYEDENSQFFIDNFDINSSGNLNIKEEDIPQESVQQRVDKINNVSDSKMNDFDHSVQEAQYDELFNSKEYDDYADKNGIRKEPKFKLKDDE